MREQETFLRLQMSTGIKNVSFALTDNMDCIAWAISNLRGHLISAIQYIDVCMVWVLIRRKEK